MRFPNASPMLNFGEAIERAANNLLNINGRSRRSEFWWTMLVVAISFMIPCISSIVILLTIPLTIRRLHDTGLGAADCCWLEILFFLLLLQYLHFL